MCGIIAVLRRPSTREVPELVELLGLLESVSNSLSVEDLKILKKQVESLDFVNFVILFPTETASSSSSK